MQWNAQLYSSFALRSTTSYRGQAFFVVTKQVYPSKLFVKRKAKEETMEYYPRFLGAILRFGVRTNVLLARSPLANAVHWPQKNADFTQNYAEIKKINF